MTDWLKYEWTWREQSAVFRVDMQYWNLLPVLSYTQLVEVSVSAKHPGGRFRAADHYLFNLLRKKLIDKMSGKCIYVGGVSNDTLRNLYFYANDPAVFQEFSELCGGYKSLSVSMRLTREQDYATYYSLLYPDDAKLQSVENEVFLKELKKKENELTLVHRVRMTAAFLNAEDRSSFMENATVFGLTVGQCFSLENGAHSECCYVFGYAQLTLDSLNKLTSRLIRAIAPREGLLSELYCE